ncbi:MAG: SDR family NAD(P)-dependent oxidoreductase, partial [Rhodobacteraceae bacterium]|nr:SDR family NAD(P)-dependent oxidoreductase [Paracoccaceae bacterium]
MSGRLENKTALITGAARGIGLEFAKSYVLEGARVCIADIDIDRARDQAEKLGECAYAVHLDVRDQRSIDTAVDNAISRFGQIDILVNNAALFSAAPIVEIERSDFQTLIDVNVSGPLFMMQAVAKHMIEQNVKGKIINMASQAGRRGEPLVAVYCAT